MYIPNYNLSILCAEWNSPDSNLQISTQGRIQDYSLLYLVVWFYRHTFLFLHYTPLCVSFFHFHTKLCTVEQNKVYDWTKMLSKENRARRLWKREILSRVSFIVDFKLYPCLSMLFLIHFTWLQSPVFHTGQDPRLQLVVACGLVLASHFPFPPLHSTLRSRFPFPHETEHCGTKRRMFMIEHLNEMRRSEFVGYESGKLSVT